jgi:hypothetical protein
VPTATPPHGILCPFDLHADPMARFLNCELADDPHYTGLEVQWFDDAEHGCGMLVFLERRADRLVDYYVDPGLRVDRANYVLGAGTGAWTETSFEVAELEIGPTGVRCHVAFTDLSGRDIEVEIDDRRPGDRATGSLLAPVGSAIEEPASLLLVHLHGFDLVRRSERAPRVRIDGRQASTGVLPGRALHGRELIKYAAPLTVITLNRSQGGALRRVSDGDGVRLDADGIAALEAHANDDRVRLELRPSFPDVETLPDQHTRTGDWRVFSGEMPGLAGGRWRVDRDGDQVTIDVEVTRGWRPGPLPPLMRTVTTVLPVFRRWPTTYRWRGVVTLAEQPSLRSGWERTGKGGSAYRRATGSAG